MRVLIGRPLCAGLLLLLGTSCATASSAVVASEVESLGREMARSDAEGHLLSNDRRVAPYVARLRNLQVKCREDLHHVGWAIFDAERRVKEAGRPVTLMQVLAAVDNGLADGQDRAAYEPFVGRWVRATLAS